MAKKKEVLELKEVCIILRIPEGTTGLTVKASIVKDGKEIKVKKKLDFDEVQEARADFLDNVAFGDDYDANFVLSDEAKAELGTQ